MPVKPLAPEHDALLGAMHDSDLAKLAGCSKVHIGVLRRAKGKPPFKARGRHARPVHELPEEALPLRGQMPDPEIARRYGVPTSQVRRSRIADGIQPIVLFARIASGRKSYNNY